MNRTRDLALVTGASSGIGAELARALAARSIDLVITARRQDRLESLREEIESRHGTRVEVIAGDLTSPDGAEQLFREVHERDLEVSILVNNAGFGYYGEVVEQELDDIHSILQVNVVALTTLTRLFAAPMRQRRRGFIMNVSSFAALQPIPRYAVYSGAKAYVVAFSQALRHELKSSGVRVSVLCPGFTTTEFHEVSRHRKTALMRLTSLDARHVARAGVRGMFKGKTMIVPGLWYKLNAATSRLLPRSLASALSAVVVKS